MSHVRTGRARAGVLALMLVCVPGVPGLAGCADAATDAGGGAATSGGGTPSAGATPSGGDTTAGTEVLEVSVSVQDGQVQPPPRRVDVERGMLVRLQVTSDRADELHVHGFGDPEVALEPGVPATLDLRADETGQFEVETHGSRLTLLTLAVR